MYAKVFQYKFPSITEAKVAASFCSDNLGKQITKFNFQSLNIMIGKEGDLSIFIKFNTIDKIYNVILLEGIFSTYNKNIRDMLYSNIFIDIPNKIRKKRRLERDSKRRDRTICSIEHQYTTTVEPMYKK